MPQTRIDPSTVPGWGIDADPRNDPTYPMRNRSAENIPNADWPMPTPQKTPIEVLQSVEYNRRPAVFGVSTPPKGASGMIRRAAFRFSENDWWHWLLLLGADRVNMVEGIVQDMARGKVPNIPAEMGARAAWKHNRLRFMTRLAVIAGTATAVALLLSDRKPQPRSAIPRRLRAASSAPHRRARGNDWSQH